MSSALLQHARPDETRRGCSRRHRLVAVLGLRPLGRAGPIEGCAEFAVLAAPAPLAPRLAAAIGCSAPSTGHPRLRASRAADAQATVGRVAGRGSNRLGAFSSIRAQHPSGARRRPLRRPRRTRVAAGRASGLRARRARSRAAARRCTSSTATSGSLRSTVSRGRGRTRCPHRRGPARCRSRRSGRRCAARGPWRVGVPRRLPRASSRRRAAGGRAPDPHRAARPRVVGLGGREQHVRVDEHSRRSAAASIVPETNASSSSPAMRRWKRSSKLDSVRRTSMPGVAPRRDASREGGCGRRRSGTCRRAACRPRLPRAPAGRTLRPASRRLPAGRGGGAVLPRPWG